jgi:putative DNA primase/helicase
VFSETQVNTDELQQYREESDSVLSFVKEYCELDGSYSAGSTNCSTHIRATARNAA